MKILSLITIGLHNKFNKKSKDFEKVKDYYGQGFNFEKVGNYMGKFWKSKPCKIVTKALGYTVGANVLLTIAT